MGELVEDLRTQLIDQDTGFFRRRNSVDRLDIYQTGARPLIYDRHRWGWYFRALAAGFRSPEV